MLDAPVNTVADTGPVQVSSKAQRLHDELFIGDLHADSLLSARALNKRGSYGHVDLPRLRDGNVAIQAFTIVTKVPWGMNIDSNGDDSDQITLWATLQFWPVESWWGLKARALHQIDKLNALEDREGDRFVILKWREDVAAFAQARAQDSALVAGFIGIEGAHALEGSLSAVDELFDAGVRMMGPTHFFDNDIGGSAHGLEKGGLTELGRSVISRMDELGMLLDLAHASSDTFNEALQIFNGPAVVSHTGVKGTCDNARNLTDAQIQAIAATGGLIGIGYWPTATCGSDTASIVRAIRYTADLVGTDHVALGSDFDGGTQVPFDTAGLPMLTQALLDDGFSEQDIAQIMGLNLLRLLEASFPSSTERSTL